MNKKIKIIDLLNKIANGEELTLPKRIKLDNYILEYIAKWQQYVEEGYDEIPLLKIISEYNYSGLNDEVEILEDNTEEIEELDKFDIQGLEVSGYSMTQAEYLLEDGINENRDKINEIIRYIKRKDKSNE